jgi:hypothetical protein
VSLMIFSRRSLQYSFYSLPGCNPYYQPPIDLHYHPRRPCRRSAF